MLFYAFLNLTYIALYYLSFQCGAVYILLIIVETDFQIIFLQFSNNFSALNTIVLVFLIQSNTAQRKLEVICAKCI